MNKPNILILGQNGMVGNTIYQYFVQKFPNNTFGTDKLGKFGFKLSTATFEKDFKIILNRIGEIDFVINCIGATNVNSNSIKNFNNANILLPKKIEKLARKNKFKVIHISSDAVFDPKSHENTEMSKPNPKDLYGKSKLAGEINSDYFLNIRTSIIGKNHYKNSGLYEWVKNSNGSVKGFINQEWSGCTSLQLAKFCEYIITNNNFVNFREKSYIYHFTPLGPISKYELVRSIADLINTKLKILKANSDTEITRYLSSIYLKKEFLKKFNLDLNKAIREMVNFN